MFGLNTSGRQGNPLLCLNHLNICWFWTQAAFLHRIRRTFLIPIRTQNLTLRPPTRLKFSFANGLNSSCTSTFFAAQQIYGWIAALQVRSFAVQIVFGYHLEILQLWLAALSPGDQAAQNCNKKHNLLHRNKPGNCTHFASYPTKEQNIQLFLISSNRMTHQVRFTSLKMQENLPDISYLIRSIF